MAFESNTHDLFNEQWNFHPFTQYFLWRSNSLPTTFLIIINGIGIWIFNYLNRKFLFSDRNNPLIVSFIDIFQFILVFEILVAIY